MKVQCPNCSYTRDMPDDRIPDGVLTARCPQCGQTFRFSKQNAARDPEKPQSAVRLPADGRLSAENRPADPELPSGAIVREQAKDPFARPAERPSDQTAGPRDDRSRMSGAGQAEAREAREDRQTAAGSHAFSGHEEEDVEDVPQDRQSARQDVEEATSFNPWECAGTLQEYMAAFYQTCLRVMFAPQRFFAGIEPRPVLLALVFFLTVCALQTVIEHVWGLVFFSYIMPLSTTTDPQLRELGEMLSSKGNFLTWLLLRCAMLCLQLYIFAGILYLCWRLLAPGRVEFSVILQVLCYAQAPMILSLIPGVGTLVGMIWGVVCSIVGCRAALRLSWSQTMLGVTPLLLLILFSYMHVLSFLG